MEGRQGTEATEGQRNKHNTSSKGNEWEVVSLTASVYAAAPPPHTETSKTGKTYSFEEREEEAYRAMFMSDHFVFPPNQHENLPLEPLLLEPPPLEPLTEATTRSELCLEEEEGDGIRETSVEASNSEGQSLDIEKSNEEDVVQAEGPLVQGVCYPVESAKAGDLRRPGIPREVAWWRRRAAFFYTHVKEVNTFWSIIITATVMGIVVLGHRWQQERWQALQLKWRSDAVAVSGSGFKETPGLHRHGSSFATSESRK